MASMTVAEALALVLREAAPLPAESVALAQAHGRVLADDLAALRTQPPADVSAMDGYAVRAADIGEVPASLALVGEVAAGRPFAGTVGPGEAARIFTGGVMPAGADTVVIQEHTSRADGRVLVEKPTDKGRNVRPKGLDFAAGTVLLRRGQRLSARDVALAAAMNHPKVGVHRRPKVAVLATGDELVMPGSTPGAGEIVYSNGFATLALAEREGCETLDLGIAPDRLPETAAAIRSARASGADILVTSGGASVGDYDLVQQALGGEGLALSFWKIAMRPGRPMLHGRLGAMHVLGLPGNPVSAFVGAFLFLVPLIRRLMGRTDIERVPEPAVLGCDLPENDERTDYLRATLRPGPDGSQIATPHPLQDSSMLVPLAAADCLLIRAPHAPAARAGSPCAILKLGL
ncbi:MAG TPA: gephyrin-like molybdotransferase Glp [Xanthobacteraceae bacterium]